MYDHEGKREYEYIEYDLRGKMYKDLPDELKECFDSYAFDVVKQLNCTDEEVAYHMRRYNRQKSLNVAQNAITYSDFSLIINFSKIAQDYLLQKLTMALLIRSSLKL